MSGALKRKRKSNFTQVSNEMIEDARLSYKAKGVFLYLFAKVDLDDWVYNMSDIVKQSKDGKDGVLSGIKELEAYGYIERIPCRAKGAKFSGYDYILDETPSIGEESQGGLSATAKPQSQGGLSATANPPLINTDNTNTDFNVTGKPDDEIPVFSETMIEAIKIAEHLSSKLSESMDNFKAPSTAGIHGWAKDIDLAIRKDRRTKSQLIEVIKWVHDGSGTFWIANVRSGKKLRDQFDTMWFQMRESKPTVPVRDRAREAFGLGKVFFKFKDTANGDREVHVCLYGDYGALYDYRGNKYIDKAKAEKVWKLIDDNFESIVTNLKKAA